MSFKMRQIMNGLPSVPGESFSYISHFFVICKLAEKSFVLYYRLPDDGEGRGIAKFYRTFQNSNEARRYARKAAKTFRDLEEKLGWDYLEESGLMPPRRPEKRR